VVSGIRTIIDMGTTIHTLTAIIGTLTLTIAVTGGRDNLFRAGWSEIDLDRLCFSSNLL
jgi:hypothetical protein